VGPFAFLAWLSLGPRVIRERWPRCASTWPGWSVCSTRARLITAGVTVASAGVAAEDGQPMSPDIQDALTGARLDTADFTSRL